jgi:hypothetical protein
MIMKKKNQPNWIIALILSMTLIGFVSCEEDDPKSNIAGIISFGFSDAVVSDYTFGIDQTNRTISNSNVLPYGTDVSALRAVFEAAEFATVTVGGVEQVSGVTVNNFTEPVTYTVTAEDGITTVNYTVTVNVSQVNPDEVSWHQLTNAAQWNPLRSVIATRHNDKIWVFGSQLGSFNAYSHFVYSSSDGVSWTQETATIDGEEKPFPPAEYSGIVLFQNQIWIVGGHSPGESINGGTTFDRARNDLWKSTNGTSWTMVSPEAWPARLRPNVLVHDNKMWIISGNPRPVFNILQAPITDVWSSTDGETWTQVTATYNFPPRTMPAAFTYDNKMFISGGNAVAGNNPPDMLNDLWYSTDGATWTQVNVQTPYPARWGHKIVAYGDRLFMIGGESDRTGNAVFDDLWISEDGGVNWREVSSDDPEAIPSNFSPRTEHSMFVDPSGDFWIIGGKTLNNIDGFATYLNDVWKGRLSILE